jgi:peptidoglycan/xylan/chitin deacetylase (PgdA/CDA1 family)
VSGAGAPAHPLADLLTVMWHYVRSPSEPVRVGAGWVTPERFEAQLDAIGRTRTVVGWSNVAEALDGGRPLPAGAALLTFDDGLADHARTVAPRLLARGWTGVFFTLARQAGEPLTVGHAIHVLLAELGANGLEAAVRDRLRPSDAARLATVQIRERANSVDPIDVLKRPLQRDLVDVVEPILHGLVDELVGPPGEVADALHLGAPAIETMRDEGLTIGGHGRRHLWFDHASPDAVAEEIRASATFLAGGAIPWPFAYPYGAAGDAAADELAQHGFAAAFHAAPRQPGGAYHLGRVDAEDPDFEAMLFGAAE